MKNKSDKIYLHRKDAEDIVKYLNESTETICCALNECLMYNKTDKICFSDYLSKLEVEKLIEAVDLILEKTNINVYPLFYSRIEIKNIQK